MDFPNDTSSQSINNFSYITGVFNDLITSNDLQIKLNLKQDLLTASTNLLGVGSAITDIDYNKITLNKPTNFQADWNSTVINKPDVYTKTEVNNLSTLTNFYNKTSTDTLLNAKENILTFSAPLTRTTNTIGINLNNYVPFTALSASNYITNSVSGLTNYYDKTSTDTLLNAKENTLTFSSPLTRTTNTIGINLNSYVPFTALSASNYITNSVSGLVNYYDKSTSDGRYTQSNFTPSYIGLNSCNYITNNTTGLVNYYNKTSTDTLLNAKENTLTFSSPLTRTTNTIGINLNSYVPFTALSASNYINNSVSTLTNYPSYSVLNSCNYSSGTNFLKIDGTNNMTGKLGIGTVASTTYYVDIYSGGASAEGIRIYNGTSQGFIVLSAGVGGKPGFVNFHRATDGLRVGYIGYTNLANYLDMTNENGYLGYRITGNLLVNERTCLGTSTPVSTNTKLSISGTSSGYSQPLVDIKQTSTIWDGNYALQVTGTNSGYTNLNGLRLNGADTGNTIYQTTLNTDISISQTTGNTTGGNINLTTIGAGGNIIFYTNGANERMRINSSGNVGIGTNNPNSKLDIRGNFSVNTNTWNISSDGVNRTHYGNNDASYYCCGGGSATGHVFMNSGYTDVLRIYNNGNVGINSTAPRCKLDVSGVVNFHNGSPLGSQYMTNGSLTIGGTNQNYGGQYGSQWGYANTAGLLMECLDNTEICIHDAGHRISSFMYYEGGANANNTNKFTMGRPMGWDSGRASIFNFIGNVGISNPAPTAVSHVEGNILGSTSLWLGRCDDYSCVPLAFGQNNPNGYRNFVLGWEANFYWSIGDYGNTNGLNNFISCFSIYYTCPINAMILEPTGYVTMPYGHTGASDIKIKTDIRTIDDALWKVKQLRGVYYTHITEGTKNIGLIAQEVEHVIPEVVSHSEKLDIKCLSYQNLVALLINAIKEQQEIIDEQEKKIENIMDILNRNNIK